MEEGLKRRLVGAAVLASLAVIFVPMLIEEPAITQPELLQVPVAPQAEPFDSSMLREEVVRPQPVPLVQTPQPEVESPEAEAPPEPIPAAQAEAPRAGLTAWVVQVGSFSSEDNASKLVDKLRKAGFQTPAPERVELRGKVLYRVRVGPMVDKDKAEELLPKINRISGTKGLVSRYP